jgi:hypothetical protein
MAGKSSVRKLVLWVAVIVLAYVLFKYLAPMAR